MSVNEKTVVCLHGASRNHNYGDVLLMAIYKRWIEDAGGEVIMDMANSYYGNYLNVSHSTPIKQAIDKADILIYGGGGYFGEPRKPSLRWRTKFVLHHMMPGILANLKKKPYGFFGIGFGPLDNFIIRKIGMFAINGAKIVSVRDEESKQFLIKYGYKGKIHVIPDSALSIAESNNPFHIPHKDKEPSIKRVALHTPLDPGSDLELRSNLFDFIKKIISNVSSDGIEYYFLIDHGLGQNCYQYKFYESINQELSLNWKIKEYSNPADTLSFISSCDVIITTKLHVAITSYSLNVKPIGISKHPKTKRFFKQVNLSHLHFDLRDLANEASINSILNNIFDNHRISKDDNLTNKALENKILVNNLINCR